MQRFNCGESAVRLGWVINKPCALAAAVFALSLAATAASAEPGGVPDALNGVNATLQSMNTALNGLTATVGALTISVDKLVAADATPPGATVLATPPLSADIGQDLACQVANVGTTPANISISVIGHLGTVLNSRSASLDAGHAFGTAAPGDKSQAWCQFTADVPAAQLRADIVVISNGGDVAVAAAR